MQKNIMELRATQWVERIHAAENSGMKISEWCQENHVPKSSYYRWKQLLQQKYLPLVKATTAFGMSQAPMREAQSLSSPVGTVSFAAFPLEKATAQALRPRESSACQESTRYHQISSPSTSASTSNEPSITLHIGEYSLEILPSATSSQIEAVLQAVKYVR